jgi:hypothetical protein
VLKKPHIDLYLQDNGDDSGNSSAKNQSSKIKDKLFKGQFGCGNEPGFGFWTSPSASQEKLKQVASLTWTCYKPKIQNQNSSPEPSHKAKEESNLKIPNIRIAQNNMATSKTTW